MSEGAVPPRRRASGKADCRRIASRVSRCSVLTEDLPSVGLVWQRSIGSLAHVSPLLKISCREVGTPAPGSAPGPPSALGHSGQGLTGLLTLSPVSRRSDCMIWNVVV